MLSLTPYLTGRQACCRPEIREGLISERQSNQTLPVFGLLSLAASSWWWWPVPREIPDQPLQRHNEYTHFTSCAVAKHKGKEKIMLDILY